MGSINGLSALIRFNVPGQPPLVPPHTWVQEPYLRLRLRLQSLPELCWRGAGFQLSHNCAFPGRSLIQTSLCRLTPWLGPAFSAVDLQHDQWI